MAIYLRPKKRFSKRRFKAAAGLLKSYGFEEHPEGSYRKGDSYVGFHEDFRQVQVSDDLIGSSVLNEMLDILEPAHYLDDEARRHKIENLKKARSESEIYCMLRKILRNSPSQKENEVPANWRFWQRVENRLGIVLSPRAVYGIRTLEQAVACIRQVYKSGISELDQELREALLENDVNPFDFERELNDTMLIADILEIIEDGVRKKDSENPDIVSDILGIDNIGQLMDYLNGLESLRDH